MRGNGNDDARWTVRLAEELAPEGDLLGAIVQRVGAMPSARTSPAAIFDALTGEPHAPDSALLQHLEVLAGPGEPIPAELRAGDLWIRRALGEGRLAHLSVVAAPQVLGHEDLESRGMHPEGSAPGLYLHVVEAGPFPRARSQEFARRISHDAQHVAPDSLLLRLRSSIGSELDELDHEDADVPRLTSTPTPGHYYQIQRGNTLLGITGRAYGVPSGSARLALARTINDHPFNLRLRRPNPVQLFPQGIISFYPRFASAQAQLAARDQAPPSGSQYAVIFIPPRTAPGGTGLAIAIEGGVAAELDEQAEDANISFDLRVGDERRVRATARTLPVRSYTWSSADPTIASVTPLGTPQTHPNRARIRALRAGQTTVTVRYLARNGSRAVGNVALRIAAPPPPVDRQAVIDALRQAAIARATRHDTFLTERAVTDAIDGRASRAELETLFNELVDALVRQHATDPAQVPALRESSAARLVGFLEDDVFRCAADGNRIVIHRDVIDAMKLAWTRSGETQEVTGATCRTAPAHCPTAHQALHTTGDASHFVGRSELGIRVIELAGLFGVDLRTVASGARARQSVKELPAAAPLANLSVIGIRTGSGGRTARELHVARQTPRQVASVVAGEAWRNLGFAVRPGTDYHVFKRRYFEASLHRQWGRDAVIEWLTGLVNFYHDRTGERVGVGDVSHILGEDMTDHGSHERGRDVDIYGLEAPAAGSTLPRSHWAVATGGTIGFKELTAPDTTAANPAYGIPGAGVAALTGTRATRVQTLWVTLLAYCAASHTLLNRVVWHGAHRLRAEAVAEAQRAWDETEAAGLGTTARPGWRSTWGPGPADRTAIVASASKFVGDGSPATTYGARTPGCNPSPPTATCPAWPLHQDHVHVRFN